VLNGHGPEGGTTIKRLFALRTISAALTVAAVAAEPST
jgi:hypothetical protein